MAIIQSELKFYKAQTNNDSGTNGGLMSSTEATTAVGSVLPSVSEAERTAGVTRFRKLFLKVENDADLELFNPFVHVTQVTAGDDMVVFHAGTQTDTQSGLTGSEDLFGAGVLDANVSASATTLDVAVEDGTVTIFRNGENVKIDDGTNSEIVTLSAVPSVVGDVVTLTFTGTPLQNSYSTAGNGTEISSLYEPTNIDGSFSAFTVTSGSGTYDNVTYPVLVDNIGAISDSITITFDSATTFTASGTNAGSLGSGNTSTDFSPVNSDFGKPYFTLSSAGFGGTYATSDTITFNIVPASTAIWLKHIVPAATASITGNFVQITYGGESA